MNHNCPSTLNNSRQIDQYDHIAEAWIAMSNSERNAYRLGILDEWMQTAIGNIAGQTVIDLGCGEGRFSRMLAGRGAQVVGIDCCERFIGYASEHAVGGDRYQLGVMEDLSAFAEQSFDLAVSYISLVDVPNLSLVAREVYRVLRRGGRFVVCNIQPMCTAGNRWVNNKQGRKLHYLLDDYFDEGTREMPMCGGVVVNYHRTLSTLLNSFLQAGFSLTNLLEPKPTPEQCIRYPAVEDLLRVPLFAIYEFERTR